MWLASLHICHCFLWRRLKDYNIFERTCLCGHLQARQHGRKTADTTHVAARQVNKQESQGKCSHLCFFTSFPFKNGTAHTVL